MKIFSFLIAVLVGITAAPAQSLNSISGTYGKLKREEKKEWHNLYIKGDKVYGTGADKAYEELLVGKSPKRKTVVAIIDSGVDLEHEDLSEHIWVNEDEIAGNNKDDDKNGFVDDVHGWNFLVDSEGNDIGYDNLEATRVLRLSKQLEQEGKPYPEWMTKEVMSRAAEIYNENGKEASSMQQFSTAWKIIDSTARAALGKEEYDMKEMKDVDADGNEDIKNAKQLFAVFRTLGVSKDDLQEMNDMVDKMNQYYLNFDFDPRAEFTAKGSNYGNNHYEGAHAEHGTHVAGIVAAVRGNEYEAQSVAGSHAEIMILRAVPDGDERDIDVANAIRYAADNGAHVINMSFGKGISPKQDLVYEALEYAASKGVLMIHAAGNDASSNDEIANYPNDEGISEAAKASYLTIGALAPVKRKKFVAPFSNYGVNSVELFAPGADIYSTLPDNEYGFRSGTSMAAPTAAGVAALVWAYHPELTAAELKSLLLETGIDISRKKVILPGSKEKVRFETICGSGRAISAYDALKSFQEEG